MPVSGSCWRHVAWKLGANLEPPRAELLCRSGAAGQTFREVCAATPETNEWVCNTAIPEGFADVDAGVRRTLEFAGGTESVHGDAPRGRDTSRFQPKADWEIEGRAPGGRGPGGGGR